jgi:DNA-binding NarL/FixJ family response regulator
VSRETVREFDELRRIWPPALRLTHEEQVTLARGYGLEERDLLILKALSHGLNEQEAALIINYSQWTVRDRMAKVRTALRAKTTAQAVANAFREGLIT